MSWWTKNRKKVGTAAALAAAAAATYFTGGAAAAPIAKAVATDALATGGAELTAAELAAQQAAATAAYSGLPEAAGAPMTGMFSPAGSASMGIESGAYTPSNIAEFLKNAPGDPGQSMGDAFASMMKNNSSNAMQALKSDPAGTLWGAAKGAYKGMAGANAITGMFGPQQAPMSRGGGMAGGGGGSPPIPQMFESNTPGSKPMGKNLDLSKLDLDKLSPEELAMLKKLLSQGA